MGSHGGRWARHWATSTCRHAVPRVFLPALRWTGESCSSGISGISLTFIHFSFIPHSYFPLDSSHGPPWFPFLSLARLVTEACRSGPVPPCPSAPQPARISWLLYRSGPGPVPPSSGGRLLLCPSLPLAADPGCNCSIHRGSGPFPEGLRPSGQWREPGGQCARSYGAGSQLVRTQQVSAGVLIPQAPQGRHGYGPSVSYTGQ